MKHVTVKKLIEKTEEKEPIKNRLVWYDSFYKKMLTFDGTRLTFEYTEEEFVDIYEKTDQGVKWIKRIPSSEATEQQKGFFGIQKKYIVRPKAEIHYKKIVKKEKKDDLMKKWFKNFQKYNRTNIELEDDNTDSMVFSVPEDELNDFINDLYRQKMEYDIS